MALYSTFQPSPIQFSAIEKIDLAYENESYLLRLAAIGDNSTGKTALLKSIADNHFIEDFYLTTGETFRIYFDSLHHSGVLEMHDFPQLSDAISADTIDVTPFNDFDVILSCFAIDSQESFDHICKQLCPENWKRLKKEHTPIVLVGLKSDLRKRDSGGSADNDQVLISEQDVKRFAKQVRASAYVECSSLTGDGVHDVVEMAVNLALRRQRALRKKCSIM